MAASLHSFAQRCCSSLSFFLWLPALMVLVVIHCGHYFIVTAILTLVRLLVCWCCNIYESVRSCNKFCLLAFQVFNFYYSIRQSARMNWAWCKRFNGGTNIERERERRQCHQEWTILYSNSIWMWASFQIELSFCAACLHFVLSTLLSMILWLSWLLVKHLIVIFFFIIFNRGWFFFF